MIIKRSRKNTIARVIIHRRLEAATELVAVGYRGKFIQMHLDVALSHARSLPDNPGNRAIRASIVACLERLHHDAR